MDDENRTLIGAQRVNGSVTLFLQIAQRPLHIVLSDHNAHMIIACLKEAIDQPITETPEHLKGMLT